MPVGILTAARPTHMKIDTHKTITPARPKMARCRPYAYGTGHALHALRRWQQLAAIKQPRCVSPYSWRYRHTATASPSCMAPPPAPRPHARYTQHPSSGPVSISADCRMALQRVAPESPMLIRTHASTQAFPANVSWARKPHATCVDVPPDIPQDPFRSWSGNPGSRQMTATTYTPLPAHASSSIL